jgi:hypothetical protein
VSLASARPPLFVHVAVHHPKPEHVDDVLASMQQVAEVAAGAPGLVQIGPWRDARSGRLVGLSLWESEDAFRAAMPGIFAIVDHDPDDTWEQAPIESFHLTPALSADQP